MLCQARARYLVPPLFHDQSSTGLGQFWPLPSQKNILRKVPNFAVFKLRRLPGVGDTAVLACCPATCSTLSTCSPVIRRLSKSSLHCTVVKIHETSFRGFQIRRLSIAKTPIQEVFLSPPPHAFSLLIAEQHHYSLIIVVVIRHLAIIILPNPIHSFLDHYSSLLLILPPIMGRGWRIVMETWGCFLFSSRQAAYSIFIGEIFSRYCPAIGILWGWTIPEISLTK